MYQYTTLLARKVLQSVFGFRRSAKANLFTHIESNSILRVAEAFNNASSPLKFLIVKVKLLTGFDGVDIADTLFSSSCQLLNEFVEGKIDNKQY